MLDMKLFSQLQISKELKIGASPRPLCGADMSSIAPKSNCMQSAVDLTLYRNYKLNEKDRCIKELEIDIPSLTNWSVKTGLVFNTGKTKFILCTSKEMFTRNKNKLKDGQFKNSCNSIPLERAREWKMLGVTREENLTLNKHVSLNY